jgi:hypothetical protein
MVHFERMPFTKRYIFKALKFASRHPKTAFLSAILGIGRYMTLHEYQIAKTRFIPTNPVEEKMMTYSDTWQHIHTYQHTINELKKYEPLVNSGGTIVFHDIVDEEVSKAISDYFKDRKDFKYVRYFNNNSSGIILKE